MEEFNETTPKLYIENAARLSENLKRRHAEIPDFNFPNQSVEDVVSNMMLYFKKRIQVDIFERVAIKNQLLNFGSIENFKNSEINLHCNSDDELKQEISRELMRQGFDDLLKELMNMELSNLTEKQNFKNVSIEEGSHTANAVVSNRHIAYSLGYGQDNLAWLFVHPELIKYEIERAKRAFGRTLGNSLHAYDLENGIQKAKSNPSNVMYDIFSYIQCRTCFMDDSIRTFVNNFTMKNDNSNDKQCAVVLLGGGYDTRLLRLDFPLLDKISLFEIDAYGTHKNKRRVLSQAGIDHSRITYIQCDFTTESWYKKLYESDLQSNTPTLFIMEGVTMYLDSKAFEETLLKVSEIQAPCALSFDYWTPKCNKDFENLGYQIGEPFIGGYESDALEKDILKNKYSMKILDHLSCDDVKDLYLPRYKGETFGVVTTQKCFMMVGNKNFFV